jgi:RNA binding exosome subunit
LQFVFIKADAVRNYFPKTEDEEKIVNAVNKAFSNELHPIMDSAYYDAGMRFFNQSAISYERLNQLDRGNFFLLTREEILVQLNKR